MLESLFWAINIQDSSINFDAWTGTLDSDQHGKIFNAWMKQNNLRQIETIWNKSKLYETTLSIMKHLNFKIIKWLSASIPLINNIQKQWMILKYERHIIDTLIHFTLDRYFIKV